MDALRFNSAKNKPRSPERAAFKAWLHENGRIAAKNADGFPDVRDCTAMDSGGLPTNVSLDIVRDTENNCVHYASLASLDEAPPVYERRFVQLDHEPTPFPESLAEWRVTV